MNRGSYDPDEEMKEMTMITNYLNLYLRSCTSDLLILDEAPDW